MSETAGIVTIVLIAFACVLLGMGIMWVGEHLAEWHHAREMQRRADEHDEHEWGGP